MYILRYESGTGVGLQGSSDLRTSTGYEVAINKVPSANRIVLSGNSNSQEEEIFTCMKNVGADQNVFYLRYISFNTLFFNLSNWPLFLYIRDHRRHFFTTFIGSKKEMNS